MELKKLNLEDASWMDSYFAYDDHKGCDMCFANIYLWSHFYKVGYALVNDCLVFADPEHMDSVCFPFGKPENIKTAIEELEADFEAMGKPFVLHLVSDRNFELLEQWWPGKYKISDDRDLSDYVYNREDLIRLSGKKYHGKKNHVNKFRKTYPDWTYEHITDENVEECFSMAMEWRNLNDVEADEEKRQEVGVAMNALRLMKELHLRGGLLRVNGKPIAFSVGEPLNSDMYVVHIEKALTEYEGAYAMINQQFVLNETEGYPYINREDDTGDEGLRQAKESYHPAFLLKKGLVTRIKDEA